MKILYIGHYREGNTSGWAQSALNRILAMDSVGIEVVPRLIKLNNIQPTIPERIRQLEQNSVRDCQICIQEILPHLYYADSHFKNIAVYFVETNNFEASSWERQINLMDEGWCSNTESIISSKNSRVNIPLYKIPPAIDVQKFQKGYEPLRHIQEQSHGDFLFYFIGDFNRRKNIAALLKAFHLEFTTNEPVSLVIKIGKAGLSETQLKSDISDMIKMVREQIKHYRDIRQYKPEIVLTDNMSEEDLCSLHVTCDSFVCPSFGEGFSLPVLDAMGFGSIPICNDVGGPHDYIKDGENGFLVENYDQSCFGMNIPTEFPFLYTGKDVWKEPSIPDLRRKMRDVYNLDKENRERLQKNTLSTVYEYSYEKIGNLIKERLHENQESV